MTSGSPLPMRRWLPRPLPDTPTRVFCLPYSGAGASMFARWPDAADGTALCPVQLPGRENRLREPHFGTYEQLARDVVGALLPAMDRPFGLFGHCSSALIVYEIAVALRREGLPMPRRLFLSSQVAPHEGPYGSYLTMTDEQLRAELVALSDSELDDTVLDLVTETLRADVEANKAYRPAAPVLLDTSITTIGWTDDQEVAPELMSGWDQYAEKVHRVVLPGVHHTFLGAPAALLHQFAEGMAADD
ncbi:thioesterase II family protein [Streptomyces sp. M92]|uniref:thioesterase II family protein n=1 Tax=Streptomyces sp. M92 TaxID=2944250 RepID=UPI00234BCFF6|nr:thioesterase domain-containing protein [Streptomyces sp. M92]WCN02038.1 thioesterase domain-containing protein [Streptomyces sp. M92]